MIHAASSSSPAGIATAVASIFTAFALVITAVAALVPLIRKVDEVHTIVNQQRTDAQRYQEALVRALSAAGVDIPIDQSIPSAAPPSGGN